MLTQTEADQFIQMVKHFVRAPSSITIPPGGDDTYELASLDDRESFLLDIWRGTLRLTKLKFQKPGANRDCVGPPRRGRRASYQSGRTKIFGYAFALVQRRLRRQMGLSCGPKYIHSAERCRRDIPRLLRFLQD
jgi:hypothetical protein